MLWEHQRLDSWLHFVWLGIFRGSLEFLRILPVFVVAFQLILQLLANWESQVEMTYQATVFVKHALLLCEH